MYSEMQILVIWNNHEYGVLINGNVKCVENQGRNIKCMHVKCKSIVTVWNNYVGIKFHLYHLTTILWGNFFYFFYLLVRGRFSTNFLVVL
jgi:hypothetical protein